MDVWPSAPGQLVVIPRPPDREPAWRPWEAAAALLDACASALCDAGFTDAGAHVVGRVSARSGGHVHPVFVVVPGAAAPQLNELGRFVSREQLDEDAATLRQVFVPPPPPDKG